MGVGISHQALTKFAELLKLEAGSGPGNLASKFSAAELRTETGGGETLVTAQSPNSFGLGLGLVNNLTLSN